MKIPNLSGVRSLVGLGKALVIAHRPEILFGASVVATVGSTVLAAKGGYEARGIVEEEKFQRAEELDGKDLTVKEKAALTWKCYVPAGLALTTALTSTTGLHIVHVKDKKALMAASLMALDELKKNEEALKVANKLGIVSDDEAAALLEERSNEAGIAQVVHTDGEVEDLYLVRDLWTGRDIWSNKRRIEEAVCEVNNVLSGSGDVELNHFYKHAGLGMIQEGFQIGWSGETLYVEWGNTVRDDGRPVRTFRFLTSPERGYESHRDI